MSDRPPPAIHNCPICKIAMVRSRPGEQRAGIDSYKCLSCELVIVETAKRPDAPKSK